MAHNILAVKAPGLPNQTEARWHVRQDMKRFPNVTELDLSGNHFECVPHSLRAFRNLKSVTMAGNPCVDRKVSVVVVVMMMLL